MKVVLILPLCGCGVLPGKVLPSSWPCCQGMSCLFWRSKRCRVPRGSLYLGGFSNQDKMEDVLVLLHDCCTKASGMSVWHGVPGVSFHITTGFLFIPIIFFVCEYINAFSSALTASGNCNTLFCLREMLSCVPVNEVTRL